MANKKPKLRQVVMCALHTFGAVCNTLDMTMGNVPSQIKRFIVEHSVECIWYKRINQKINFYLHWLRVVNGCRLYIYTAPRKNGNQFSLAMNAHFPFIWSIASYCTQTTVRKFKRIRTNWKCIWLLIARTHDITHFVYLMHIRFACEMNEFNVKVERNEIRMTQKYNFI